MLKTTSDLQEFERTAKYEHSLQFFWNGRKYNINNRAIGCSEKLFLGFDMVRFLRRVCVCIGCYIIGTHCVYEVLLAREESNTAILVSVIGFGSSESITGLAVSNSLV